MRVLGIDYGTKRMGVAIGDTEARVAVPFTVLEGIRSKEQVVSMVGIIRKEKVELVVMGQGGKGPIEKKVQAFAEMLRMFVKVEIADEHFTTAQVERMMKDYGKARKGVDKDAAAAALILQGWLDSKSSEASETK